MKITFLGTNGWYDTATGNTICTLVESGDYNIILDAGNGLYKIDRHIKENKPTFIFLSHFHLDHITGLHILDKFDFTGGLRICGQSDTKKILAGFINFPFTKPLNKLRYKTEIYELPGDSDRLPFHVESLPMFHSSPTLGYRFEIEGKVLSYCPDTGYCENAVKLSRNADMVIAECAYKSGQDCKDWPHLNPESAARIAQEAGAKRLALVHFDAALYKILEDRSMAESAAKMIFNNTFCAIDDMQVEV